MSNLWSPHIFPAEPLLLRTRISCEQTWLLVQKCPPCFLVQVLDDLRMQRVSNLISIQNTRADQRIVASVGETGSQDADSVSVSESRQSPRLFPGSKTYVGLSESGDEGRKPSSSSRDPDIVNQQPR